LTDLLGGWKHLTQLHDCDDVPAPPVLPRQPSPEATSEILEGYANALYKLGRRYECGQGAASNPREAIRCYCKSARLGNLWAMARLAANWMAHRDPFGRSGHASSRTPPSDA
jgi:TPR repeat protein